MAILINLAKQDFVVVLRDYLFSDPNGRYYKYRNAECLWNNCPTTATITIGTGTTVPTPSAQALYTANDEYNILDRKRDEYSRTNLDLFGDPYVDPDTD